MILAGFYIFATLIDWTLWQIGENLKESGALLCSTLNTLVIVGWRGASYMFLFSVTSYLYCLVMWFTFYRIPKKYGMVNPHLLRQDSKMKMLRPNESRRLEEDNVKTLIVAMEEDNQQLKKMRKTVNSRYSRHGSVLNPPSD